MLQPYSALQRLSVGLDFVVKYASLISQMQNLKYLGVQENGLDVTTPAKLPSNSFPMLTTLKFSWVHLLVVESIWESMPDMFRRLATLECAFFPSPAEDEGNEAIPDFPLRFATFLNSGGPHITNLTLHFDPDDYFEDRCAATIDEQTLKLLAELPLRELSVESADIYLPEARPGGAALECEFLASTFPDLEVLRWTSQEASYKDLYAFVKMPNLRHLGLRLVDTLMTADMFADHCGDTSHLNSPFRILETDLKNNRYLLIDQRRKLSDWRRIAGYVARIWPHIQIIPQTRYEPSVMRNYDEERLNDNQYELLNKFIVLLRDQDSSSEKSTSELWKGISAEWNAPIFPKRAPLGWEY